MKEGKTRKSMQHNLTSRFYRLFCITLLIAFCASFVRAEELRIQSFHQLTPSEGWVLVNNHLLVTDSAGTRWTEITPPEPQASIDGVFFLDRSNGWAVLSTPDASPSLRLAQTTDGGARWTITGLTATGRENDSAIYGGTATISFADETHGWILLRSVSGINFSIGILLRTVDGGRTWNRLPDPPIADGLLFVSARQGWLSGGPDNNQVFVTSNGGYTWNATSLAPPAEGAVPFEKQQHVTDTGRAELESKVRTVVRGASIGLAQLNSTGDGWLDATAGDCAGFKTGCSQTGHLLAVNAGVVTEITPPIELQGGPSPFATTAISTEAGFDKCAAATVSQMSTWWASSPFFDANIYIGGVLRACSQANLTSSWVSSIFSQGWYLIPTWVGPQASCSTFSSRISTNTTTAFNQGVSEATSAISAANGLGLSASIIYYDMENYNSTDTTCKNAVNSFISGWVQKLHSSGFLAGVYGSATNANSGWATVANVPDDVWIAKWDGRATTLGLTPLPDSLWSHCQRIHQYQGGHNETWGGVTFNIDSDIENGRLAAPTGTISATCTT